MKLKPFAIGIGCAAGAYLGFSALVFHEVFERNARLPAIINESSKKKDTAAPKRQDSRSEWMHEQKFTTFTIKNDRGETLCGHYLKAAYESKKYVLCSHGYRNRGKGEFRFISKFYHDNGYNILLVDHIASGESEGTHITFGYHESSDLLLWVNFLNEKFGSDIDIILHGISMGCASVLMLAGNFTLPENVRFIIADCGFTSVKEQFENVLSFLPFNAKPMIETVGFINKLIHGYSLSDVCPSAAVEKINIPVLFIHGGSDGFVAPSMTQEMFNLCHSEKELLIVENAGHAQSYQKNRSAYEERIIRFTKKYVGE